MVDFNTSGRRPSKVRSNGLFAIALLIVGLVGYAFVENAIRPPLGDSAAAPQSLLAQAPD